MSEASGSSVLKADLDQILAHIESGIVVEQRVRNVLNFEENVS